MASGKLGNERKAAPPAMEELPPLLDGIDLRDEAKVTEALQQGGYDQAALEQLDQKGLDEFMDEMKGRGVSGGDRSKLKGRLSRASANTMNRDCSDSGGTDPAIDAMCTSLALTVLWVFVMLLSKYGLRIITGVSASELRELVVAPMVQAGEEAALAATGYAYYTKSLENATGATFETFVKVGTGVVAVTSCCYKKLSFACANSLWLPVIILWYAHCDINGWIVRERQGMPELFAFLVIYVVGTMIFLRRKPGSLDCIFRLHTAMPVVTATAVSVPIAAIFFSSYHDHATDRCQLPMHKDMSEANLVFNCDFNRLLSPDDVGTRGKPFVSGTGEKRYDPTRYFLDGSFDPVTLDKCEVQCRPGYEIQELDGGELPQIPGADSWLQTFLGNHTLRSKKNKFVGVAAAAQSLKESQRVADQARKTYVQAKEAFSHAKTAADILISQENLDRAKAALDYAAKAVTAFSAAQQASISNAAAHACTTSGVCGIMAAPATPWVAGGLAVAAVSYGGYKYMWANPPPPPAGGAPKKYYYTCIQGVRFNPPVRCKEKFGTKKESWRAKCPAEADACRRSTTCTKKAEEEILVSQQPSYNIWSKEGAQQDAESLEYDALQACLRQTPPSDFKWTWASNRIKIALGLLWTWSPAMTQQEMVEALTNVAKDDENEHQAEVEEMMSADTDASVDPDTSSLLEKTRNYFLGTTVLTIEAHDPDPTLDDVEIKYNENGVTKTKNHDNIHKAITWLKKCGISCPA